MHQTYFTSGFTLRDRHKRKNIRDECQVKNVANWSEKDYVDEMTMYPECQHQMRHSQVLQFGLGCLTVKEQMRQSLLRFAEPAEIIMCRSQQLFNN